MPLKNRKKILFISLFNNYTGSTKVLSQVINASLINGFEIEIITSSEVGFLSNLQNVKYHFINFKWTQSKILLMLLFIRAQIQLFYFTFKLINSSTVVYINTITPIGAIAACILKSNNTIIHVHEKYINKNKIYKLMEWFIYQKKIKKIFVSNYLIKSYNYPTNSVVIHNSVPNPISHQTNNNLVSAPSRVILLIASCRLYKGIEQFIDLSNRLMNFNFELVLSCNYTEAKTFLNRFTINNNNFKFFPVQEDLSTFYERADLVMNLSLPNLWIETFGMTILEALSYGKPCIVPNVGGPVELIDHEQNGYLVDPYDIEAIEKIIKNIFSDVNLYEKMRLNAFYKYQNFKIDNFNRKVILEINKIAC